MPLVYTYATRYRGKLPRVRVLHIGIGNDPNLRYFDGWEELRAGAGLADLTKLPTNTFDAVYARSLQHLHPFDLPKAVAEYRRVLTPDGLLAVVVPNLVSAAKLIAQEKELETAFAAPGGRNVTPLDLIFGYRQQTHNNDLQLYRSGFTPKLLKALLTPSFKSVAIVPRRWQICCTAFSREMTAEDVAETFKQVFA